MPHIPTDTITSATNIETPKMARLRTLASLRSCPPEGLEACWLSFMLHRGRLQAWVVQRQQRPRLQLPDKKRYPNAADSDGSRKIHPTEPSDCLVPGRRRQDHPGK